jgi:heme exporter protein A
MASESRAESQFESETGSLEVRDLACERDGRLLFCGLDFSLKPGCALQIEGPNGAGKSTLIRTLVGSASEFEGEICWNGQPFPNSLHQMQQSLLYIGHNAGIRRGLTPLENLSWYGADREDALRALDALDLYGFEDTLCQQLSAGQTRRVALARLFLPSAPRLWILDEPLAALDVQGVACLEAQFARHLTAGGSVLLTSHQPVALAPLTRVNLADFQPTAQMSGAVYAD